MAKIQGLRSVKEWRSYLGAPYDPWYAELMFDTADGQLWCDVFYDIGHNDFKVYHSSTIVNLGAMMAFDGPSRYTMATVKDYIAEHYPQFA